MRYVFVLALLCIIFGNTLSEKDLRMRMARAALQMKIINERKEKVRKLQASPTEQVDEETEASTTYTYPDAPPEKNATTETKDDEPENPDDVNAPPTVVKKDKPLSENTPPRTDNKLAFIQVVKFHSFYIPPAKPTQITFKVFFYYYNRIIVPRVIFRIRVTYSSRLRSLEENIEAESVRSICDLVDTSLAGKNLTNGTGESVNYNCNAETSVDATKANVSLNTDVKMALVHENGEPELMDFAEVNFNGNATEESQSLQENDEISNGVVVLKNTIASTGKNTLNLTGNPDLKGLVKENVVKMTIINNKGKENVTEAYNCTVVELSSDNKDATLECDATGKPIRTHTENLHLTSGIDNYNTIVIVEMDEGWDKNSTSINTNSENRFSFKNSSSGLSGGSIAGIVIACVVVIIAASLAAILLRKPAPPLDNTTIVDLKTTDNL